MSARIQAQHSDSKGRQMRLQWEVGRSGTQLQSLDFYPGDADQGIRAWEYFYFRKITAATVRRRVPRGAGRETGASGRGSRVRLGCQ